MKNMVFSKRLILVYTLLVVTPVSILLFIFSHYYKSNHYADLTISSERLMAENVKEIESFIDSFALIESVILANTGLKDLLQTADVSDEMILVSDIVEITKEIERLLFVTPHIYALRIFFSNDLIYERWPVFLSESRTNAKDLQKWEYNYKAEYFSNLDVLKEASICKTTVININRMFLGYLQISMRMEDFFHSLYKNSNMYESFYFVADNKFIENNTILEKNVQLSTEIKESLLQKIYETPDDSGQIILKTGKIDSIFNWQKINKMNAVLIHSTSTALVRRKLQIRAFAFIFSSLIFVIFIGFVIRFTTTKLMSRLYYLIDGMRKVKEGNFYIHLNVDGSDEIADSQHAFNLMVEKIRNQIDEIQREQTLVTETKIKALQSQINTHFLYNVLETIKMQAELNDQEDIAQSITTLGKMMRYCLHWKNNCVTIQDEIAYVNSYIFLINLRNDYIVHLETNIDKIYEDFEIPKMVLQPIIENAFFYAIEPKGRDATIEVYTFVDEKKQLYLCVRDYGENITDEGLEKVYDIINADDEVITTGHIGLRNIQQRLYMFYGEEFSLQIKHCEGGGLEVRIPIKGKDND